MDSPTWWNNRLWQAPDYVAQSRSTKNAKPPIEFEESMKLHWNSCKASRNGSPVTWLSSLTATPKIRPASPASRCTSPGRLRVAYTSRPVSATFRPDVAFAQPSFNANMMILGQNPFLSACNSRQGSQESLVNLGTARNNQWRNTSANLNRNPPESAFLSPRLKQDNRSNLQVNGESRSRVSNKTKKPETSSLKRSNSLPLNSKKEDLLPEKTALLALRGTVNPNKLITYGFKSTGFKMLSNQLVPKKKEEEPAKVVVEVPCVVPKLISPTTTLKTIVAKTEKVETVSPEETAATRQELLDLVKQKQEFAKSKQAWDSSDSSNDESTPQDEVTADSMTKLHSNIKEDLRELEKEIDKSKEELKEKEKEEDVQEEQACVKVTPKSPVIFIPRSIVVDPTKEMKLEEVKTVVNIPITVPEPRPVLKEAVKPILKRNQYSSLISTYPAGYERQRYPSKAGTNVTDSVWREIFKVEGHQVVDTPDATDRKKGAARPYSAFQSGRATSPCLRRASKAAQGSETPGSADKRRGVRFDMRSISVMEFHPGEFVQNPNY
ncbi:hypothetical protein Ciccas_010780 [Cichlidogyrus casuarinus]|uniref:Uncharacterized protein n=1 Tax=Cichlidogyrus casuarinus TaxID=1844966 RepID=A0ABD2PT50_9PLAT